MPPKDLVIGEITNYYFLTPDGQQIEINGVINDVEVTSENIPDGIYIPKIYDIGSLRVYITNNSRKFGSLPKRRGVINKRFKKEFKNLFFGVYDYD